MVIDELILPILLLLKVDISAAPQKGRPVGDLVEHGAGGARTCCTAPQRPAVCGDIAPSYQRLRGFETLTC